jgi:hypothetical protein
VPSELRPEAEKWLVKSGVYLIAESGDKAVYSNRPGAKPAQGSEHSTFRDLSAANGLLGKK